MKRFFRVQIGPKAYLQTLAKSQRAAIEHLRAKYGQGFDIISVEEFAVETVEA